MLEAEQSVYRTGQFARRAKVTERTLRFYDRAGLLSPTGRSESGYRLYSDDDLAALQQILALKFLGFSLEEIRRLRGRGPEAMTGMLDRQRSMLFEKRRQIDSILGAIDRAAEELESGRDQWEAILGVIEVIQMDQTEEWVKKYFTDEQLAAMQDLGSRSYTDEARQKLASRPWTEEDQERASAQWKHVYDESERLASAGADPAGDEAQAVVRLKAELLSAFTQNDPEIEAGLRQFWENHKALPEMKQPLASWQVASSGPGAALLDQATAIYNERQKRDDSADAV